MQKTAEILQKIAISSTSSRLFFEKNRENSKKSPKNPENSPKNREKPHFSAKTRVFQFFPDFSHQIFRPKIQLIAENSPEKLRETLKSLTIN